MKHSRDNWFLCMSLQHSSLINRMLSIDVVCNRVKSLCNLARLSGLQASSLCKLAGALCDDALVHCVYLPCAVDPLAAPISRLLRVQAVLQQLFTAGQHTAQP